MRSALNILLVAVLTAALAQVIGWIAVPVVAVVVSLGAKKLILQPWNVGAGAALAWAGLLVTAARSSAFPALLSALGSIFRIPGPGLVLVSLLIPFVLGWSTGVIMTTVINRVEP